MKKIILVLSYALLLLAGFNTSKGQSAPQWTNNLNALPDTVAVLSPIRTLTDNNGDVLVLSSYFKSLGPGINVNKIYVRKLNSSGNILWTNIFDNNGNDNTICLDMALDAAGNCFVAGSNKTPFSHVPMILKITSQGNFDWMHTGTTAFSIGRFNKIIYKNNFLYLLSNSGIAKFNTSGIEQWSNTNIASNMEIDNNGQIICSSYSSAASVFRLDANGVVNFSDSTIVAICITIDTNNDFYLLSANFPSYQLIKYSNAGILLWSYNQFSSPPPFGDIGLNMITDLNNDLIISGINDTLCKFSPSGILAWKKPMFGLDSYKLTTSTTLNNFIVVAGSTPSGFEYNMQVALFDLNGNRSWVGNLNSGSQDEFAVDMAVNADGIYALEEYNYNTTLAKFEFNQLGGSIDYSLICIDSIWYDPLNANLINVSVFNGNVQHVNYPSVQIVSPLGDTIGNPSNLVNFFAQIGNTFQTYSDSITITGITDFSGYTFLFSENFGDTTVQILLCNTVDIENIESISFAISPNPVTDFIRIESPGDLSNCSLQIYNLLGQPVKLFKEIKNTSIDVNDLVQGFYLLEISNSRNRTIHKFYKN